MNLTAVTPKRVRELRGDRTQAAFAHILGVRVQTIRNWESGRTQPGGAQLMLLHALAEGKTPVEPGLSQAADEELLEEVMRRLKRAAADYANRLAVQVEQQFPSSRTFTRDELVGLLRSGALTDQ